MRKSSSISRIAIFFAVMITIHFVTSFILQFVPSGIQPTLVHIPVVIASIIYGPRTGAILGLLMGLFSLTMNTLVITPASYLFSPFVPPREPLLPSHCHSSSDSHRGNPYFVYRWIRNRTGLVIAGIVGSYDQYCFRSKRDLLLLW